MSADSWERSRRCRASPHIRYSGSENTSRATNIVRRSSEAPKSIIPPSANIVSGKISVCATPAFVASFSATLPGTADAIGVNASRPAAPASTSTSEAMRRSAISSVPRMPTTSRVPCRNSAGLSRATAPPTAVRPTEEPRPIHSTTTATSAATWPPMANVNWTRYLTLRGRNASTSTPRTATPSTINIGDSSPYSTDGAVMVIWRVLLRRGVRGPAGRSWSGCVRRRDR